MWGYLRFYPSAVRYTEQNRIYIPQVMHHVFLLPDFECHQIAGLVVKGFDYEFGTEISDRNADYLRIVVR